MDDETNIIETPRDFGEANRIAASWFIDNLWSDEMEEPMFEVYGGFLNGEIDTDGSMGGRESVYVREGRLRPKIQKVERVA
ncbi:hypothetical protein EK21DRAFT_108646 [Setomelanomma holmii]|uniref:Uncharacterized protein n=1 Tax=Setomelanomma holmii TaxID=210430 RepID=A0A9P4LNI0_9PLEO|nr:hypothetical protein EK21DRAFT_108646 [Setomelanomma holmii]